MPLQVSHVPLFAKLYRRHPLDITPLAAYYLCLTLNVLADEWPKRQRKSQVVADDVSTSFDVHGQLINDHKAFIWPRDERIAR